MSYPDVGWMLRTKAFCSVIPRRWVDASYQGLLQCRTQTLGGRLVPRPSAVSYPDVGWTPRTKAFCSVVPRRWVDASYQGLLQCRTQTLGGRLVPKPSAVSYPDVEWSCGGVAHSFCRAVRLLLNRKNVVKTARCQPLSCSVLRGCNRSHAHGFSFSGNMPLLLTSIQC